MASQLRGLSRDGDDEDVRNLLLEAAKESEARAETLASRLGDDAPSALKNAVANTFSSLPATAQSGHIEEERIVQNLIAGFTMLQASCGMYRALESAAASLGDGQVTELALSATERNTRLATQMFHLVPTRSIIAYNMLTVSEIDPSVNTKYGETSWAD